MQFETHQKRHNYTYGAFGKLEGRSGSTENNYQFAGEQFDGKLGEYYLRQRYYNTETGQFSRRDTYEGSLENPASLHKYLYANANPAYYVDPSGNSSIGATVAISVLTGILAELLFPDPLQTPKWEGDYTGPNSFREPFEMIAGVLTGSALTRLTSTAISRLSTSTIQVFRVEGSANARVLITDAGEVVLDGSKTLFLNFGQRARAIEFLALHNRE